MKKMASVLLAAVMLIAGNTVTTHATSNEVNLPKSEVVEEFDVYNTDMDQPDGEIVSAEPRSHITYKVTQLGRSSEVGAYTGQSVSGEPGVTVSLSKMESFSFSASSNVAWNVRGIAQAALGFNFGKSFEYKHSGSRTIPMVYKGRKVKRAEIKAYELYDKYTFKVTWTSIHVRNPQYYGTYWAKKPSGYHYAMEYFYQ